MSRTVIALGRFEEAGRRIAEFLHADFSYYSAEAFGRAFSGSSHIIAVMSAGIAVRSIAPLLEGKWSDPAVVVVDPGLTFAIPLIGGHHGANDLARELASLGITPVITTATERAGKVAVEVVAGAQGCRVLNHNSTVAVNAALLDGDVPVYTVSGPAMVIAGNNVSILVKDGEYSVGLGCRRGTSREAVEHALREAFQAQRISPDEICVYATTEKKAHEAGIIGGVRALGGTLVFLEDEVLLRHPPESPSRAGAVGLAGVAEPAALATSRKKEIVMKKTVFGEVTVAIAR